MDPDPTFQINKLMIILGYYGLLDHFYYHPDTFLSTSGRPKLYGSGSSTLLESYI